MFSKIQAVVMDGDPLALFPESGFAMTIAMLLKLIGMGSCANNQRCSRFVGWLGVPSICVALLLNGSLGESCSQRSDVEMNCSGGQCSSGMQTQTVDPQGQNRRPELIVEDQGAEITNSNLALTAQDSPNLPSEFDQNLAFKHLQAICKIGPRVSASRGMKKQQKYIKTYFNSLGGKLLTQPFKVRSPYTGKFVQLDNLIVQFHPQRKKRLLLCCHHDTRPFPDADPINPKGSFIGANDGASGVALLMEMGRHLKEMEGDFGIDLIFFDGEEFVIQRQRDPMFLGSTHFSNEYAAGKVGWKYEYGILV
ncbi:MAG: M28 family peptidase, partial [Mariniblastus sp.]|nr:M28 family peptidase [Mariniblastus sp.]